MADYKWSPIQDLPKDSSSLSDGELKALIEVWLDQKSELSDSGRVAVLTSRLCREWAIETGIIENAYALDRGITQTLIEQGIKAELISRTDTDRDPDEVAAIIQDHLEAVEGLFDFVKGNRDLAVGYIRELHAVLMRHVKTHRVQDQFGDFFDTELKAGVYKTLPNNPKRNGSVHEYCPPEQVASEMDRLVALHAEHVQRGLPAEVQAAWIHHAFTQIHPFSDGNGRVARAIASLLFIRAGSFPLVVNRDDRGDYIRALEMADEGSLRELVRLSVRLQRRSLLTGIHAIPHELPLRAGVLPNTVEAELEAARRVLFRRGEVPRPEWEQTKSVAGTLFERRVSQRLAEILEKLKKEFKSHQEYAAYFFVGVPPNPPPIEAVAQLAKATGYEANVREWHRTTVLTLKWNQEMKIVVSMQAIGPRYRGVIAGLMFVEREDASRTLFPGEPFQMNYKDGAIDAEKRLEDWLERGLAGAFAFWRKTL
jgi:Fic family protein